MNMKPPKPILPGAEKWHQPKNPALETINSFPFATDAAIDFDIDEVFAAITLKETSSVIEPPQIVETTQDNKTVSEHSEITELNFVVPTTIVRAHLAPLWRRAFAAAIDGIPTLGVAALVLIFFEKSLSRAKVALLPRSLDELRIWFWTLGPHLLWVLAVVILATILYHTLSLVYMQATAGDLLFGIRWITSRGERPQWGRALARSLLIIPSYILCFSGALFFLLVRSKRPLYDVVSGLYPVQWSRCEFVSNSALANKE